MRDGDTIVFVEVRHRSHDRFGSAAESITARKQQRIAAAARHYLASHAGDRPCRFDAVLLTGAAAPTIEWVRDAFGE